MAPVRTSSHRCFDAERRSNFRPDTRSTSSRKTLPRIPLAKARTSEGRGIARRKIPMVPKMTMEMTRARTDNLFFFICCSLSVIFYAWINLSIQKVVPLGNLGKRLLIYALQRYMIYANQK